MNQIFTREQIAPVVVNLRQPHCPAQCPDKMTVGTGTLIVNSKSDLYIVTAAHVASDMKKSGHVIIGDQNDKPIRIEWSQLTDDSELQWNLHTEVDIAVIKIQPESNTLDKLKGRFLPADVFYSEKTAPSRDVQLTSIGFPLGLGTEGYFSPLTFTSRASSSFLTMPRADNKQLSTFFILENPSIGGYSGCPVFDLAIQKMGGITTTASHGTRCHGIMHGTISDNTGGKLAAVTPSFHLFDLIEK